MKSEHEEKRSVGWPKLRWTDEIAEDLQGLVNIV